jgi:HPr kinase/phosphorylase
MKLKSVVDDLKYEILYQATDYERVELVSQNVHRPGMQFMGYYGYFDPERIQLIGRMETEYLATLPLEQRRKMYDELLSRKIPALVICRGINVFDASGRPRKGTCDRAHHGPLPAMLPRS